MCPSKYATTSNMCYGDNIASEDLSSVIALFVQVISAYLPAALIGPCVGECPLRKRWYDYFALVVDLQMYTSSRSLISLFKMNASSVNCTGFLLDCSLTYVGLCIIRPK